MRGRHVPDDVLHRFLAGELDDAACVSVAHHLDGCPSCAGRAARADPLHVSLTEEAAPPVLPPDLAQELRALSEAPPATTEGPGPVPALLAALLGAAALLVAVWGEPLGAVVDGVALGRGLGVLAIASTRTGAAMWWLAPPATAVGVGILLLGAHLRQRGS